MRRFVSAANSRAVASRSTLFRATIATSAPSRANSRYRENAIERASRVSVCRWHLPARKATNSRGGCCRGADRQGPVISPMKLRTPLKLSERNFKPAI
jgi:hypothetical protein